MNENLDPNGEDLTPQELEIEKKLRPLTFDDFTGQDQALENLHAINRLAESTTVLSYYKKSIRIVDRFCRKL